MTLKYKNQNAFTPFFFFFFKKNFAKILNKF